jgi:hypothetical protein
MTMLHVPISEQRFQELSKLAQAAGMTPEELVQASIDEWLSEHENRFADAARYVLEKNKELYRRLA